MSSLPHATYDTTGGRSFGEVRLTHSIAPEIMRREETHLSITIKLHRFVLFLEARIGELRGLACTQLSK